MNTMAIVRHNGDGEYYLAELGAAWTPESTSRPLAFVDEFGSEAIESDITPEQWFDLAGGADVEPFESEEAAEVWARPGFRVVYTFWTHPVTHHKDTSHDDGSDQDQDAG